MTPHLISNIGRGAGERNGSRGNYQMEKIGLITYQMAVYCLLISNWTRKTNSRTKLTNTSESSYQDLERNQLGEWNLTLPLFLYKQASDLDSTCSLFAKLLYLFATTKTTKVSQFLPSLLEKIKAQVNYLPHSNDKTWQFKNERFFL